VIVEAADLVFVAVAKAAKAAGFVATATDPADLLESVVELSARAFPDEF
jgi:hypothetical protein